jgi:hypothetical protein
MTNISKTILALTGFAVLFFSSCSKTTEEVLDTANNTVSTPSVTVPTFNDGYGALAAVTTVSTQTVGGVTVPVSINLGVAAFFTSAGGSSKTSGGTVNLNGKTLTQNSDNSYVYQKLTDPLSFAGGITWDVSGSGTVPAFSYTDDKPVPTYSDGANLPSTVTRSAGLTMDLAGKVSGADSIYVVLISTGSSYIIKHLAGNASQCVFTPAELSGLAASTTGIIEVCPWNYKSEDFSGKKFYFINEGAYTRSGITIN